MRELRISLEQGRPEQPSSPGSRVTGRLLVNVDKPKRYANISIQFFGRAYVHWSVDDTSYSGSEVYVNKAQTLWTPDRSPEGCLSQGQHIFPFRFTVPPTAPPSFEGTDGTIRYELRGRIKHKGFLKLDHHVEVEVSVKQAVRLSDPWLLEPVHKEMQKSFCCLCCASPPVVLTVTVHRAGYCIGETLPVHLTIENGSSLRITLNASLRQSIMYTAEGRHRNYHRYSKKTLDSKRSHAIAPRTTSDWDPVFEIPETEVLDKKLCSIIQVTHFLLITTRSLNLTTRMDLVLGNEQPLAQSTLPQPPARAWPSPNPHNKPPPYQQLDPVLQLQ